jgi:hypothetical protein
LRVRGHHPTKERRCQPECLHAHHGHQLYFAKPVCNTAEPVRYKTNERRLALL